MPTLVTSEQPGASPWWIRVANAPARPETSDIVRLRPAEAGVLWEFASRWGGLTIATADGTSEGENGEKGALHSVAFEWASQMP
jgi:hypothetical protein